MPTSTRPTEAPALLIRDDGLVARVDAPPDVVLEELVARRRRFTVDGVGGVRSDRVSEPLFDVDRDGRLAFFSGLAPRVAEAARRAGYRVEVLAESEPPIQAAPLDGLDLVGDRRRLAEALVGVRRGVVLAASWGERLAAIDLILRLFSPGRIMVVTTLRNDAFRIAAALRRRHREPVACYTRQYTQSDARIQVGTYGCLDLDAADVIVFEEATQVLHVRVLADLQTRIYRRCGFLARKRFLGLLDPRAVLGRREQLVIESCLGPVVGGVGIVVAGGPSVKATFADWPGGERPDLPLGLEWKRTSIWANSGRNAAVARIATALAGGDAGVLGEFGLFLEEEVAGLPDDRRVALLVESAEHARALGRLLPGWRLRLAGQESQESGQGTAVGGPELSIDTITFAYEIGGLAADVVVRADGTPWPLDPAPRSIHRAGADDRPLLLVDLADHQDGTARDATRGRWCDYRNRGWGLGRSPFPILADLDEGLRDAGHGVRERGVPPRKKIKHRPTLALSCVSGDCA